MVTVDLSAKPISSSSPLILLFLPIPLSHPLFHSSSSLPLLFSRAQAQLVLVNQAYSDVLKTDSTRQLYDQLCKFRQVSTRWEEREGGE